MLQLQNQFNASVFADRGALADYFVSSINGSDPAAGTEDDPFDSLDDVEAVITVDETVALENGSTFQSQLWAPYKGVAVTTYGSGTPPLIDCSDELPNADWSLSTNQTNTYEQTQPAPEDDGAVTHRIWEGDTELVRRASISDVEANAGSYYVDASADPVTIYVHPIGSTDPSSDGKLYEWAARFTGVLTANSGRDGPLNTSVEGIRIRRPLANGGAIIVGPQSSIERSIVEDGGKHHIIHAGGSLQDVIVVGPSMNRTVLNSSAVQFFNGGSSTSNNAIATNVIGIDVPEVINTRNHGGFAPAEWDGVYAWKCGLCGSTRKSGAKVNGGYAYQTSSFFNAGAPITIERYLADNLGQGSGTNAIDGSGTIRNSILLDQQLKRNTISTGETVTVENCVLITTRTNPIFADINNNTPTFDLRNSIVLAFQNSVVTGYTLTGDNNIFFCGWADAETWLTSRKSLSQLQTDTGAFGNSVWVTSPQMRTLLGEWRRGDMRIDETANVTDVNGSVLNGELPDGTSLSTVGIQSNYDPSAQGVVGSPPSQWPTPPTNQSEEETYVSGPSEWDWQGQPITHEEDVSLGSRVAGFWKMDGADSTNEPDEIGSNDLTQYGGVGAGATSNFSFRTLDGTDDRLEVSPDSAIEDAIFRTWISFPFRPDDIQSGDKWIFNYPGNSGRGIIVRIDVGSFLFRIRNATNIAVQGETIPATQGAFQVIQLWNDPEKGQTGIRVAGTEAVFETGYVGLFSESGPLVIGSRSGGGDNVDGAIGPVMWAKVAPSKADRDWLQNNGAYRTLSEIQTRTVTIKDI